MIAFGGRGRPAPQAGFTVTELLVAAVVLMIVGGAVLELVDGAQGAFQAQAEAADVQQRLRSGVEALTRDLLMAGAGIEARTGSSPSMAPVMPYRVGARESDPMAGIFYRPDVISVRHVPGPGPDAVTGTYYLVADGAAGTFQLRHYDGSRSDLPVVDHVARLAFEYVGADGATLEPATLQDGPWVSEASPGLSFDADLLRIRRVRVHLRVQAAIAALRGPSGALFTHGGTARSAARFVPDQEIQFDVAPRNLSLGR